MVKLFKPFLSLLLLALLINGCKRSEGDVDADYIKYDVIYLEKMAGDIPTRMLPNEMESYYSKRYVLTKIHGFFGQFSLVQIANLKQNTVTTMLNFFGNKVYYIGEKGEIPAGIVELNNPEVSMTDDTLRICGMISYRCAVICEDEEYDIYYTKDIDIKSPNIATPYNFIDYVLSDFRVQLSMLKMQLVMAKHERISLDATMFNVPNDYEQVSKETMVDIINSLFTKE